MCMLYSIYVLARGLEFSWRSTCVAIRYRSDITYKASVVSNYRGLRGSEFMFMLCKLGNGQETMKPFPDTSPHCMVCSLHGISTAKLACMFSK